MRVVFRNPTLNVMNNSQPSMPTTNDPDPMARRLLRAIFLCPALLFVHFVASVVFCLVSVRIVPEFVVMFEEKNALLSPLTFGVIRFSNGMAAYWYLLVFTLILVDAPLLFGLQLLPQRRRWISHLYFNGVVFLILLGIGWIVFVVSTQLSFMEAHGA